ncbi:MAG TPA: hypothetical protein VLE02_01130 [Nitrosarchaeum sp.]|nr:hypothetical protein [Nitrosarchaeum sp.]
MWDQLCVTATCKSFRLFLKYIHTIKINKGSSKLLQLTPDLQALELGKNFNLDIPDLQYVTKLCALWINPRCDKDMGKYISLMTNLRVLAISSTIHNTFTLRDIKNLTQLEYLAVMIGVGDNDAEFFNEDIGTFTKLKKLEFTSKLANDFRFSGVSKLVNLSFVYIAVSLNLTGSFLCELPALKKLKLGITSINEACVEKLTNLKHLILGNFGCFTDGNLIGLTNLVNLNINMYSKISGWCFEHLTNLKALGIAHNKRVQAIYLQKLVKLEKLHFSPAVNNISAQMIDALPNIKEVYISEDEDIVFTKNIKITKIPGSTLDSAGVSDIVLYPSTLM